MLVLWITTLVALSSGANGERNCDLRSLDAFAKDVLPFAMRTTMGVTPEEIAVDCEKTGQSISAMKELAGRQCLKSGIAIGVAKLMIEGAEKESALRCDPDEKKGQDYRKYIPCLNKIGADLQRCQKRMTAEVEANLKSAPTKELVARSCCAFHRLDRCLREVAEKGCSAEHGTYVAGIVNSIAEAVVETVCTKFTAESCAKFRPLRVVKPRTRYETIIPPILEVLEF